MGESKFDLGDYVEVKDRIRILYEFFPQARIVTDYQITSEPDAKPKVIARAQVYRRPEDATPAGTGTSWLYLPGNTPYTKGSEVENAETSAVGRAIGMLGILIDKSFASRNEIEAKGGAVTPPGSAAPSPGDIIAVAEAANAPHDFEPRQGPDGMQVGFKLAEGKRNIRVVATGPLAEQIVAFREAIEGKRVQVFGSFSDEAWTMKAGTPQERKVPYLRIVASRIVGAEGLELPMPEDAPTMPLGLDAEAELDSVA